MFMRNRYNILFSLFWASLVLVGIETQAQENLKFAPNDIPVPWYSQKITGCPYTHCSLASSLMVFDYFKGMTADAAHLLAYEFRFRSQTIDPEESVASVSKFAQCSFQRFEGCGC